MDRLHALIAAAALLACGDPDASPAGAPPSRVTAVTRAVPAAPDLGSLCDVHAEAAAAAAFTLAPTVEVAPAPTAGRWRWINVWATWCRPCVEEMPMLAAWQTRLDGAGAPIDLVFVSADEDAAAFDAFRSAHPTLPPSLRLAEPGRATEWLATLGLDAGAGLPVHVLVDPAGKTRCVRAGAVSAGDYENVRRLFAQ